MSLILSIDTATENASVCLSANGNILAALQNQDQKNHAAFVQPAIQQVMKMANLDLNQIDAVAVTNGPGSYTGLRVGLASAKGLCYALQKPLLLLNTLELMAFASIQQQESKSENMLFCPLIDARRMEVFTAVYDKTLNPIVAPQAKILDENSFSDLLESNIIIFSGSGHPKLKTLLHQHQCCFFQFDSPSYPFSRLLQPCI